MDNIITKQPEILSSVVTSIKLIPSSEIKLYLVNNSQLNEIEKGGGMSDTFLQFGIACISIFISLFSSLLLTNCDGKVYVTFVIITFLSFISGVILIILWYKYKVDKKKIISEIRNNETLNN